MSYSKLFAAEWPTRFFDLLFRRRGYLGFSFNQRQDAQAIKVFCCWDASSVDVGTFGIRTTEFVYEKHLCLERGQEWAEL